jgi:molybdate transport repressor ModE-like protein
MRRLSVRPDWYVDVAGAGEPVDRRLLLLLRAVRRLGSLTAAARETAVPYRTAWAVLADAGRRLGKPLASRERGRGAKLTAFADQWLALDDVATAALASRLRPLDLDVRRAAPPPSAALRVAASHDLALASVRDAWAEGHGVSVAFHGSAEALDLYAAGEVEAAGFHYAPGTGAGEDPLLRRLRADRDALVRFVTRTQGLILPRGNPRRIRSLADVAAHGVSIVNRQPGSGTRLLFDRLLAAARIAPTALHGYTREEFTHAAVAATVAAGSAEVGFGVEAAAAQLGLAFVPLVRERYRFACRKRALGSAPMVAFRALLASDATRAAVTLLRGYRPDAPGRVAALR